MKPLGAILAGGAARRFGSDKALAEWRGQQLIDHVRAALAPHCDAVLVCGRPGADAVPDRPAAGQGPLGGLNAALHAAADLGYRQVLVAPCDTPDLPAALLATLAAGGSSAFVAELPVLGIWQADLAPRCDAYLRGTGRRSMRAWGEHVGARAIDWPKPIANINSIDDLAGLTGFFP